MTTKKTEKFRRVLESMDARVRGDLENLGAAVQTGVGGDAGGGLSNAPLHLADLGTEQYMQELNATLFENKEYIGLEIQDALGRIEEGSFGRCERCGEAIIEERLEALPYTRYCTECSAAVGAGAPVNLNAGRPEQGLGDFERRHGVGDGASGPDEEDRDHPFTDLAAQKDDHDIHAAGEAGGGTAIGGLAGVNLGEGDPDDGDLKGAMGSGDFDQRLDEENEPTTSYSGPSGGAVGGAVANLRAAGGKRKGGLSPKPGRGDSPVGQ